VCRAHALTDGEEPDENLIDDMFKEALVDLGEDKSEGSLNLISNLKSAARRFAETRNLTPTADRLLTNRDGLRALFWFVAKEEVTPHPLICTCRH
jgi:hypothetical protein